jgi:phosphate butyryltransferase
MESRIFDLLKPIVDKFKSPKKMVIPFPYEESFLRSIQQAFEGKVIQPTLIGSKRKIEGLIKSKKLDFKYSLIDEEDTDRCLKKSMELLKSEGYDFLAKGLVNTDTLLHAVLDKETGLKRESILSHTALFEIPGFKRLIIITDAGVNISPDLTRKMQIIENAVKIAKVIGIKKPKVAVLAAVEKVIYPAMPATRDADLLAQMSKQGRFKDAIVEGPYALDNAVSIESAKTKGITGLVAGQADILLVPNIEAGNILYKSLTCFAKAVAAGIVVGASHPLVVSSRADDAETKFLSILLAAVYAETHEE